jgi:hypothetical protein
MCRGAGPRGRDEVGRWRGCRCGSSAPGLLLLQGRTGRGVQKVGWGEAGGGVGEGQLLVQLLPVRHGNEGCCCCCCMGVQQAATGSGARALG